MWNPLGTLRKWLAFVGYLPVSATALVAVLVAGPAAAGNGSGWQGPLIGAYLDKTPLLQFEHNLGRKLDIDSHYGSIVYVHFQSLQKDIVYRVEPMLSLSAWCDKARNVPCKWSDVIAGKYDSELTAVGQGIAALKVPVLVRPLYEAPYGTKSEREAGKGESAADFKLAYDHIRNVYIAAGATNATFIYAPSWKGTTAFQYDPRSEDIVAEDVYNKTKTQEPFRAPLCKYASAFGKPLMISESGAGQAEQAMWLDTVSATCPSLSYFLYWNARGAQNYELKAPASFAALKAIGAPNLEPCDDCGGALARHGIYSRADAFLAIGTSR